MYRGGQDQNDLNSLKIIWPNDPPDIYDNPKVGQIYPLTGHRTIIPGTQNHIVIVGNFTDNKDQVLINTFM
jgi:hypothetical protein